MTDNKVKSILTVTITGDTEYDNSYEDLTKVLDRLILNKKANVVIQTGDRAGAETYAQAYASSNGFNVKTIEDTTTPITRYQRLLKNSALLVVCWNGVNGDTKNIMDYAYLLGIKVFVVTYETDNNVLQ